MQHDDDNVISTVVEDDDEPPPTLLERFYDRFYRNVHIVGPMGLSNGGMRVWPGNDGRCLGWS